jgi:hypothetical protein
MTVEVEAHETSTSMVKSAPAEVYDGTDMMLKVKVCCPSACWLREKIVKIITQDAVLIKEIKLDTLYTMGGTTNETVEFAVKAPTKPGEYTWTAVFPAQEKEGVLHEESSTPFSFIVKPQGTSMAVWDIPSSIVFNAKFKLKVGVRCSADCKVTDKVIEIYDHEGAKVATGTLGDVPWPGTDTLYWTEVELEAPAVEGYYTWEAKFPEPELELPRQEASHAFGFRTGKPPEHLVTVEVIDKDTQTPIKNADVILHPYRAYTDEDGVAEVEVPKAEYKLYVSKDKYKTFQTIVKVASDVTVKAELLVAPIRKHESFYPLPEDEDG